MGMSDVFTSNANFYGISEENIQISKIIQKTVIVINEDGSKTDDEKRSS